jgi:hypothetical protein
MKLTKENKKILELLGFVKYNDDYWKFHRHNFYVYLPTLKSFQDLSQQMLMDEAFVKQERCEIVDVVWKNDMKNGEMWNKSL